MRLDDVVDELLGAVPEMAEDVAGLRELWAGDPPRTLLMSTIGKAYVREARHLSESKKRRFFASVEAALRDADDLVKDAVATGLLEAAVSEVERGGGDRSAIIDRYAEPLARHYVQAWDDFSA